MWPRQEPSRGLRISEGFTASCVGCTTKCTTMHARACAYEVRFTTDPLGVQKLCSTHETTSRESLEYIKVSLFVECEEDSAGTHLRCCTRWHELPRVAVLTTSAQIWHLPQSYEESEIITSSLSESALVPHSATCTGVLRNVKPADTS